MVKDKKYSTVVTNLKFPEGPAFDTDGNLWFVEIQGRNLSKWNGKVLKRFKVDGTPNGAAIGKNGCIYFTDSERGEIRTFDPIMNEFETLCTETTNGKRLKRPNDLIFDPYGNILFSDHADGRKESISTICVLPKGKKKAKIISKEKRFTNGLALMDQGNTLVFSETYNQQLWIAGWDAERLELVNEQYFAKAGKGPWGPDGMAFDEHENLFVSIFNEHHVNIYNTIGDLIHQITCRGSRPTNCAFDHSGNLGLVVTEAEFGEIISYSFSGKGLQIFNG